MGGRSPGLADPPAAAPRPPRLRACWCTSLPQKIALFGSVGDTFNVADIKDISKEENQQ